MTLSSGAARFESAAATGLPSPRTTGSSTMSSSQGGDQPGKGVKGMFGRLKNGCRLGDRKKGLTVKPNSGTHDGEHPEGSRDDDIWSISASEVMSWGDSFEQLMGNEKGRKVFRTFLRCEYSEENILFWLACEDLKKERSPDQIEEKARVIYEDYVSILSPREVSLDSRVRDIINRNMVSPSQHTFDDAQLQIYTLMHRDSYPRFVTSQTYKDLLARAGGAGSGGAGGAAGTSGTQSSKSGAGKST